MSKKKQPLGIGMTPSKTRLGKFLRRRRLKLGLRQIEVAKLSGLKQSTYSSFETGSLKNPKSKELEGLAKALQCNILEIKATIKPKPQAEPKTELGKFIRSRREELSLTLEAFAEKLQSSLQRAKLLETGKKPCIQHRTLKSLATALDLEISALSRFVVSNKRTKTTNSQLGKFIRGRREELGFSISEIAEKLGVSRQFISQIEYGQCDLSQSDDLIGQLALVLQLNAADLKTLRQKRKLRRRITAKSGPAVSLLVEFLTVRRLEVNLSQRELAETMGTTAHTIHLIETGKMIPTSEFLHKLASVLQCEIPASLAEPGLDDLVKIKELSNIADSRVAVAKALKLLRQLLERRQDGYRFIMSKKDEGATVELELLLL